MCTAIRFNNRYFGRTLDFERGFEEELVVTPRDSMQLLEASNRYSMMGVGVVSDGIPLYFDGVNEWGLAAAALNFPHYAVYSRDTSGTAIPSGRLISYLLGICRSVSEVKDVLGKITVTDGTEQVGASSPLHWIFSDGRESAVVESVRDGIRVMDNPVGVLTNSPPFDYHLAQLAAYSNLSVRNPTTTLGGSSLYSGGMGAIGLPGDYSSTSRFIRATFLKESCFDRARDVGEWELNRTFDILCSVMIPKGAVLSDAGQPVFTRYTAVIDMEKPSYYLTSPTCRTVHTIALSDSLCNAGEIKSYPIYREERIIPIIE